MPPLPPPVASAEWAVAPGVVGAPEAISAEEAERLLAEPDPDFFNGDPDA